MHSPRAGLYALYSQSLLHSMYLGFVINIVLLQYLYEVGYIHSLYY